MPDRMLVAVPEARRRRLLAPLIALFVVAIVALISYRATLRGLAARSRQEAARIALTGQAANERHASGPPAAETDSAADDLTVIEGIGPRFDAVLKAAGITTYRALAETGASRLQTILRASNGRLADPTTWPEQAQLAADGQWETLNQLQASLKAGRRTR